MNNASPLITIGITCYNSENTIARAIDCALQQDYPNIEIIIVDDGSQDSSVDIIKNKIHHSNQVRLICHEFNTGFAGAINDIIAQAKGHYIAFFDDDDISYPNRISSQLAMINAFIESHGHENLLCFGSRKTINNNDSHISYAIGRFAPFPFGQDVVDWMLWRKPLQQHQAGLVGTGTMLAPTHLLKQYRFDTHLRRAEDFDLIVRCAMNGCFFIGTEDVIIDVYQQERDYKTPQKSFNYLTLLLEKHQNYLKENKVYLYARLAMKARYLYNHKSKLIGILLQIFCFIFLPRKHISDMIKAKLFHKIRQ